MNTHPPIFDALLSQSDSEVVYQLAIRLDNADVIDVAEGNLRQYDRGLRDDTAQMLKITKNRLASFHAGSAAFDAMYSIDEHDERL